MRGKRHLSRFQRGDGQLQRLGAMTGQRANSGDTQQHRPAVLAASQGVRRLLLRGIESLRDRERQGSGSLRTGALIEAHLVQVAQCPLGLPHIGPYLASDPEGRQQVRIQAQHAVQDRRRNPLLPVPPQRLSQVGLNFKITGNAGDRRLQVGGGSSIPAVDQGRPAAASAPPTDPGSWSTSKSPAAR